MPTDVDRQIQRSVELLSRVSARRVRRQAGSAFRRVKRTVAYAVTSVTAILIVALGWAILTPIGISGLLTVLLAILLALLLSVLFSRERAMAVEDLALADIRSLPSVTERWLDGQRSALPAPALPILDRIGDRLEALGPQLERIPAQGPAAMQVQMLLAEHLPQLVANYRAIPHDLRRVERNGRVPDRQLVDSLVVIEREIGEMTEELARGDLDRLAAHGRYLELKYEGDGPAL